MRSLEQDIARLENNPDKKIKVVVSREPRALADALRQQCRHFRKESFVGGRYGVGAGSWRGGRGRCVVNNAKTWGAFRGWRID